MQFLKRFLLLVMTIVLPALLTALSYKAAQLVLSATHRVIDPEIMQLVTVAEFVLFFFIAVLEARERWPARSSS